MDEEYQKQQKGHYGTFSPFKGETWDKMLNVDCFKSISGEVSHFPQGHLCGFIRFQGCNLSCPYCDARHEVFTEQPLSSIVKWAEKAQKEMGLICLTGGEPLLNAFAIKTLVSVLDSTRIIIETNGTIDFSYLIGKTNLIVDYKIPILYPEIPSNYCELTNKDFIKFIITDVNCLQKAVNVQKQIQKRNKEVHFAYSPVIQNNFKTGYDNLAVKRIFSTLREEKLSAAINYQLHKITNFK